MQTGNGRLGTPWAAQHFGVVPDLFTTAKGAAGGLPIGLTLVRASLVERASRAATLGSTFGGGPLVLAAAAEVARRIAAPELPGERARAPRWPCGRRSRARPVVQVRGAGLLLGLVLERGFTATAVRDALLAQGVLVGTSNDPRVVRLSPPLVLRPAQAARLAEAMQTVRQKELVR